MITATYAQTMARYNAWQNTSLIAAATALDPAERALDRGSFFGSITATFNHLLWGDRMWMSRFDGGASAVRTGIAQSVEETQDWAQFRAARAAMDARILAWAEGIDTATLNRDLTWYSGAAGREVSRPLSLLVMHFFNHQTHHRGQIHAMLTAAGARPDATDLFLMPAG